MRAAFVGLLFAAFALPASAQTSPVQEREIDRTVAQARQALDLVLNDYPSARFRDVHAQVSDDVSPQICGLVNAKNLSGAYTGWKRFVIIGGDDVSIEGDVMSDLMVTNVCAPDPEMVRSARDLSAAISHRP